MPASYLVKPDIEANYSVMVSERGGEMASIEKNDRLPALSEMGGC